MAYFMKNIAFYEMIHPNQTNWFMFRVAHVQGKLPLWYEHLENPIFWPFYSIILTYFEWTKNHYDIYRATSDPGGELSEYWIVGFDRSKTGALSFTSWTFMTTSVSTCWPAPSVAISLVSYLSFDSLSYIFENNQSNLCKVHGPGVYTILDRAV